MGRPCNAIPTVPGLFERRSAALTARVRPTVKDALECQAERAELSVADWIELLVRCNLSETLVRKLIDTAERDALGIPETKPTKQR